jgi:prolyl oligopeptidase
MKPFHSRIPGISVACATALLVACAGNMVSNNNADGAAQATPSAQSTAAASRLAYPASPRVDVVEDYHGTKVPDPYRWLEALDSPETKRWIEAQNALAQPVLNAIPQRQWLKERLTQLWNYERFDVPLKKGRSYFYLRNDGTQNQSVLYVTEKLDETGRVLLDPNTLSEDATIALSEFTPNPNGSVLAYALSDGGTDWQIWKFRRTRDGVDLEDTLRHTKFWGVSWSRDGKGVYYSRYPLRPDGRADDNGQPAVYYHKLGEPQQNDRLVYAVKDHPRRVPSARVTDDGRYLILNLFDGYDRNGVNILELDRPDATVRPLFAEWDALYNFVGSYQDELYFHTTNGAPRGRVIAVNAKRPDPSTWRTIVPESELAIDAVDYVGGKFFVTSVRDAYHVVDVYTRRGRHDGRVELPGLGRVVGFTGDGDDKETFFGYTDFLVPATIFHFDIEAHTTKLWRASRPAFSNAEYVTEQVFYTSKDGTRAPMFITHRRDMKRDGNQPVLLVGYGGFNVSMMPTFRPQTIAWLEMGGVYAEAILRGGGEYGEAWHQAGTRTKKQNVFDDFIGAAEHLIREKYTRRERLAISGRSNGGLLVGAVLTQRPDLFGATLPAVGVLDMLRYHTASANARQWSSDYGLSENPEEFEALIKYSPYHNTKPGTCYPPTLITTADHDDRVVPWHSFKFAAALQHAQGCAHPILIRVETRAGHGAGKPVWMQIEDFADQFAFAANALNMPVPASPPPVSRAH